MILDGGGDGERIDIQPRTVAPSLVVSVSHIAADPSLAVGAMVTADGSKLGLVYDLSRVETAGARPLYERRGQSRH